MKALKVKVSGSYRKAKREVVDFTLEGVVPCKDVDLALMHIKARYVPMWIASDDKYKDRLASVREVYLDEYKEVDQDFSFVGKSIADMSAEELQDLATAFDLRAVPLYKNTSLVQVRNVAYATYSEKVLGKPLSHKEEGFNAASKPKIIVEEGARRESRARVTNEDVIRAEQESLSSPKESLSLDDLKELALEKGIAFHPAIGYDKLYEKIYG